MTCLCHKQDSTYTARSTRVRHLAKGSIAQSTQRNNASDSHGFNQTGRSFVTDLDLRVEGWGSAVNER
eukprot:311583-Chlamydomonas_euryale.AAC.2